MRRIEMANNKKSFLLYVDLIHTVDKVPDEIAGKLFKIILDYVNDKDPVVEDLMLQVLFEPIKQQLKRDLVKYEDIVDKKSKAGKASAEARRLQKEQELSDAEQIEHLLTPVENVEHNSTNPTVSVSDTDTVNDINNNKTESDNSETNNVLPKKEKPTAGEEEVKVAPPEKIDYEKLLIAFNTITGMKKRVVSKKVRLAFNARMKEKYTKEDVLNSIKNAYKNKYHKESNYEYLTLEYISRSDTLDKFSEVKSDSEKIVLKMNT